MNRELRELQAKVRAYEQEHERRHTTFAGKVSLRADFGEGERRVAGTAIKWNGLSLPIAEHGQLFLERFAAGSLDGTSFSDVDLCRSHDDNVAVARTMNQTLRLSRTASGLEFTANLAATTAGRDLFEEIRSGLIGQMSPGFIIQDDAWGDTDPGSGLAIRTILSVRNLFEISACPRAAYHKHTSVAARTTNQDLQKLKKKAAAVRQPAASTGGTREVIEVTARAVKPKSGDSLAMLRARSRVAKSELGAEAEEYQRAGGFFSDLAREALDEAFQQRMNDSRGLPLPGSGGMGLSDHETRNAVERLNRFRSLRADLSTTTNQGGQFDPPSGALPGYVAEAWSQGLRAAPFVSPLLTQKPLPAFGLAVSAPRFTGAGNVAAVTTDLASNTAQSLATELRSAPITEIQCFVEGSRQLFERSMPRFAEEVLAQDLAGAYASLVDAQVLTGGGSGGEVAGFLTAPSGSTTTTSSTASFTGVATQVAQNGSLVSAALGYPPDYIVMHPRRWSWLLVNGAGQQPLINHASDDDDLSTGIVGTLAGRPVYISTNIPTNAGAGTEDRIVQFTKNDSWLFTSPPAVRAMADVSSSTMTIRFQVYATIALLIRRPESIGICEGASLAAPSGY